MCGIYGAIHPRPTTLNKQMFNALGCDNDVRGGDSCGIFIDKRTEYGFDKQALYFNFWPKSKLLKNVKKCTIALGHCRKASVGGVSAEKAQPVVIREGNEVKFVLIHNGTIYNYKELAKKYIPDENINDLTDSQVMAKIFYRAGYRVLNEYYGGGMFVTVDYRGETPQVYLFKGASKKTLYGNDTPSEERPLFYFIENGSLVFSSRIEILPVFNSKNVCYNLKPNVLFEFKNGQLIARATYDRKEVNQSQYFPNGRASIIQLANGYRGIDDDLDEYHAYRYGTGTFGNVRQTELTVIEQDPPKENDGAGDNKGKVDHFVFYNRRHDLYLYDSKVCHGSITMDKYGLVSDVTSQDRGLFTVWFWKGVPLYNKGMYDYIEDLCKQDNIDPNDFEKKYPHVLHLLSPFPYKFNHADKDAYIMADNPYSSSAFSGHCIRLLDVYEREFEKGIEKSSKFVGYDCAMEYWDHTQNIIDINDFKECLL